MLRILIVDDQTLMRDGLKTILDLEDDLEVIGTASNGKEAYELVEKLKPDVILMDIRMPILNGVEATKIIKAEFKDVAIIMLTTFDTDDLIIEALECGADGYLLKDIDADRLIQSIKEAANGDMLLPAKVAAKLVNRVLKTKSESDENAVDFDAFKITEREKEICMLLCEGYSNKQICDKLFLTLGTVKNYITNIYSKLGVTNRTAAILFLKKII
ncbi:response regulator transcription factor [Clostridium sp. YIM B02505]|uniref:Stage 0 sporulation protein A homolog n=1 Tax=Clostridium yunnanense TaxID=2800325 RepID=A0ABS1ELZ8_9CLOT|nr:response regulator transcription factor [Clostridium yunnanense]MBK1810406.1 response regulator transcription factor [Clostridium yunnanense]